MTAPGVKHHFATMTELLEAVLEQWNADEMRTIKDIVTSAGNDLTLLGLADALALFYTEHPAEARNFDLLEAEAMSPDHPAHGLYPASAIRPLPITRQLAERDYEDPDAVVTLLSAVVDGLRFRWLRRVGGDDIWTQWVSVRDPLFGLFQKKPSAPADPAPPRRTR